MEKLKKLQKPKAARSIGRPWKVHQEHVSSIHEQARNLFNRCMTSFSESEETEMRKRQSLQEDEAAYSFASMSQERVRKSKTFC